MSQRTTGTGTGDRTGRVPGEPGIWIMILGELFLFGLLFGTVGYYRQLEPALFAGAQRTIDQTLGLINTIVLLSSSLFVALGLEAGRSDRVAGAKFWIRCAMASGVLFVAIKALEYAYKIGEGLLPDTNMFFMLYFVVTGMHLFHVLIGIGALYLMTRLVAKTTPASLQMAECCALFWHMVDVLWVVLFAIFYLHR